MACYGNSITSLATARSAVDALFSIVDPGSLYERPIPLRHRLVFYIGHVEAFDRNLIATAIPGLASASRDLDRLFAFGIDPGAGNLPSDMPDDWPSMERIGDYCDRTRMLVDASWDAVPTQLRHVAIEHRLMHAETLAYMVHAMCPSKKNGPAEDVPLGSAPDPELFRIEAGPVTLGQTNVDEFGWDNEFQPHTAFVEEFQMDAFKVTNGEYLNFVAAGGSPSPFWIRRKNEWLLRRMFDEIPLPLNWPVYVTQRQAASYVEWRGASLPTEEQWQRAAYADDGAEAPRGNFDFRRWDPEPVEEGMFGNGWEWTSSRFRPFPGFRPFPFYPGYSADFFDDDHFVLKGGSPRTDAVFLRKSFRNWFRSDYPYVFATFRCIDNSQ